MDKINLSIPEKEKITLKVKGAAGGTNNYNLLRNKPKINEVEISGDKEGKDYSLQDRLVPGDGIEIIDNGDHTTTIRVKSASDKFFEYAQSVPSRKWEIAHTLNKFPSVTVVDSAGSVVIGDVTYIDDSNIIISFQAAFSGNAYLN